MAVPAAHTVQNSRGVTAVEPVKAALFSKQLIALLSDIRPDAVKTGMLLSGQNVRAVASVVAKFRIRNLVIDPILRSSSGRLLLEPAGLAALKKYLFPKTLVVTPNIPEAELLTGSVIKSEHDMDFAAGRLLDMGPKFVLIKGGHLDGQATDMLYRGNTVYSFSTRRRKGEFHGTGCLLSAALTVFISQGYPVEKAVEKAKQFVDIMLKTAKPVGKSKIKYFQF